MTKNFETQIKEKTDYELVELYLNPSLAPAFIKLVEAQLVKRDIPLNNLKSLSKEDIKELQEISSEEVISSEVIPSSSKTLDEVNDLDLRKINDNIISIKNNVRFFFWFTIFSIVLSTLAFLLTFLQVSTT